MRPLTACILAFTLSVSATLAADTAAANNEARLRDALRNVTIQYQTAEAERASLEAAKAVLDQKNKDLDAKVKSLTKQLAEDKDASDKALDTASKKAAAQDAEIARLNASLEKWKQGFEKTAEIARKTEAERAKLATTSTSLSNRVADLERKNLALFKIGGEILERYRTFGFGTALAAREPFTAAMRVRLENQVQGYEDKLHDPKLKP
jgi:chromosome segregation ATPase